MGWSARACIRLLTNQWHAFSPVYASSNLSNQSIRLHIPSSPHGLSASPYTGTARGYRRSTIQSARQVSFDIHRIAPMCLEICMQCHAHAHGDHSYEYVHLRAVLVAPPCAHCKFERTKDLRVKFHDHVTSHDDTDRSGPIALRNIEICLPGNTDRSGSDVERAHL